MRVVVDYWLKVAIAKVLLPSGRGAKVNLCSEHLNSTTEIGRKQSVSVQSVPPHPDPLPWGEGVSFVCVLQHCRSLENGRPLPKGEGRGEGEVRVPSSRIAPMI